MRKIMQNRIKLANYIGESLRKYSYGVRIEQDDIKEIIEHVEYFLIENKICNHDLYNFVKELRNLKIVKKTHCSRLLSLLDDEYNEVVSDSEFKELGLIYYNTK